MSVTNGFNEAIVLYNTPTHYCHINCFLIVTFYFNLANS